MNALLFVVGLMARHAAKKAGKSVEEVKTSLGIQTGSTLEGAKKNFLEVSNEDAKQVFVEFT